jgi:hypothetical protein
MASKDRLKRVDEAQSRAREVRDDQRGTLVRDAQETRDTRDLQYFEDMP